jgi:hypothetical protein
MQVGGVTDVGAGEVCRRSTLTYLQIGSETLGEMEGCGMSREGERRSAKILQVLCCPLAEL